MKNYIINKLRLGKDAFSDWVVIFSLTFIICISFIVAGVFSYVRVGLSISTSSDSLVSTSSPIDSNALENAVLVLDGRAAKTKSIVTTRAVLSDPSI